MNVYGLKLHLLWIILASMFIVLPERWIGFFVAGCVLALFFFPLAHGPFQATHGPTTAFRTGRQLLGILYSIICATVLAFAGAVAASRALRGVMVRRLALWPKPSRPLPSIAILRC